MHSSASKWCVSVITITCLPFDANGTLLVPCKLGQENDGAYSKTLTGFLTSKLSVYAGFYEWVKDSLSDELDNYKQ